jgi:DNA polymerase III subunit chi
VTVPQPGASQRVDFYVLTGTEERPRLKVACRIAERAYVAGERVFIWVDEPHTLERLDDLLWTFADRAFVPHEIFQHEAQWQNTPVLVGCAAQPQQPYGLLVNLGNTIPASAAHAASIAEVIDAHDERRQAGRARFRQYRDRGLTPATHNMATEDAPL